MTTSLSSTTSSSAFPLVTHQLFTLSTDIVEEDELARQEVTNLKANENTKTVQTHVPRRRGRLPRCLSMLACLVCGDQVSGKHFGVDTCESCKRFFKQSIKFHDTDKASQACVTGLNQCSITKQTRNMCSKCRLDKCKQVGMRIATAKTSTEPNDPETELSENAASLSMSETTTPTPFFFSTTTTTRTRTIKRPFGYDYDNEEIFTNKKLKNETSKALVSRGRPRQTEKQFKSNDKDEIQYEMIGDECEWCFRSLGTLNQFNRRNHVKYCKYRNRDDCYYCLIKMVDMTKKEKQAHISICKDDKKNHVSKMKARLHWKSHQEKCGLVETQESQITQHDNSNQHSVASLFGQESNKESDQIISEKSLAKSKADRSLASNTNSDQSIFISSDSASLESHETKTNSLENSARRMESDDLDCIIHDDDDDDDMLPDNPIQNRLDSELAKIKNNFHKQLDKLKKGLQISLITISNHSNANTNEKRPLSSRIRAPKSKLDQNQTKSSQDLTSCETDASGSETFRHKSMSFQQQSQQQPRRRRGRPAVSTLPFVKCLGYKTAQNSNFYSNFPFQVFDLEKENIKFVVENGVFHSVQCANRHYRVGSSNSLHANRQCLDLKFNKTLQNILKQCSLDNLNSESSSQAHSTFAQLRQQFTIQREQIQSLQNENLNAKRTIESLNSHIDNFKTLLSMLSQNEYTRLNRLLSDCLGQKKGINAIIDRLNESHVNDNENDDDAFESISILNNKSNPIESENFKCKICQKNVPEVSMRDHVADHLIKKQVVTNSNRCGFCGLESKASGCSLSIKMNDRSNVQQVHSNCVYFKPFDLTSKKLKNKPIECILCHKIIWSLNQVNHFKEAHMTHSLNDSSDQIHKEIKSNDRVECFTCNEWLTLSHMREHVTKHILLNEIDRQETTCGFCGTHENVKCNDLRIEFSSSNNDEKPKICQVKSSCPYYSEFEFDDDSELLATNRPVECELCKKIVWSFNVKSHLSSRHASQA